MQLLAYAKDMQFEDLFGWKYHQGILGQVLRFASDFLLFWFLVDGET